MLHNTGKTHDRIVLWAMPISAWSGKMRSYLTKKGVKFEERFPGDPRYHTDILPGIGYFVVPVVEMPDGTVMQDSTETMQYFEKHNVGSPMVPEEERMSALAWLLNFFGSDLFLKPGMHYRWNFLSTHEQSLRKGFIQNTSKDLPLEERYRLGADFFNQARDYTVQFGVTEDSIPVIEESLAEAFAILDEHFRQYPYLLGGRPSVADSGLMTMFYAHLSRDLHPSMIMQKTAMNVFNWTERMNRGQAIYGDYPGVNEEYFEFNSLPETLLNFVRYVFRDCSVELKTTIETFNKYVEQHPSLREGDELEAFGTPRSAHPMFAKVRYELRGKPVVKLGMVDTIFQFQQITKVMEHLGRKGREDFYKLLKETGGGWMIETRAQTPIKYDNYAYTVA
jgi:glutathione S-transferase